MTMYADAPGLYLTADATFDNAMNIVLCLGHGTLLDPTSMNTLTGWLYTTVATVPKGTAVTDSILPVVTNGVLLPPTDKWSADRWTVITANTAPIPAWRRLRPVVITAVNCRVVDYKDRQWWCTLATISDTLFPFVPSEKGDDDRED